MATGQHRQFIAVLLTVVSNVVSINIDNSDIDICYTCINASKVLLSLAGTAYNSFDKKNHP